MKSAILEVVLKNLFKYSPLIVLSFLLVFVANLARNYYNDAQEAKSKYEELIGVKDEYNQLTAYVAELEGNYAKEKDLRKKAEQDWAKEVGLLKGQIKTLASATFTVKNFPHEQDAPDQVTDEFIKQEVRHKSEAGLGPPVGFVQIYKGTGKTVSSLYESEIAINSIVTRTEDGRYHVLAKGDYILRDESSLRPEWLGVPYPLNITAGEIWIDPRPENTGVITLKRTFRTTPTLNLGLFAGATRERLEYGVHGDVSLWGYGRTNNDLDYKLGGLGINASHGYFDVNVTPASYRIGNHLPLVKDLYVGPGIGYGTDGSVFFISLTSTL